MWVWGDQLIWQLLIGEEKLRGEDGEESRQDKVTVLTHIGGIFTYSHCELCIGVLHLLGYVRWTLKVIDWLISYTRVQLLWDFP